jgi:hypothetical protein
LARRTRLHNGARPADRAATDRVTFDHRPWGCRRVRRCDSQGAATKKMSSRDGVSRGRAMELRGVGWTSPVMEKKRGVGGLEE